ncbi:MAG TPA: molybdenum cofactor guanylyltransferase [bacterium]|nr:molybdenum cofactor guanylyltransferase [bacterium]
MAAIILAGGKGKRLGVTNKALYVLAGRALLNYVTARLTPICPRLILVTNTPSMYGDFPGTVVKDIHPGYGPLSGIEAGLVAAGEGMHFVTGCDMPFLNRGLIQYLKEQGRGYDVVVPRLGQYVEPLHSFYRYDILPLIRIQLRNRNFKLNSLLTAPLRVLHINENEIKKYDPDFNSFFNVNTAADVQKAERMLRHGGEKQWSQR